MMRHSLLTGTFALFATASSAAPPGVNPAVAVAFMNQLWKRAAEVLNNKANPAIREARFRELFHENFDCPRIARFVLGRYWQAASEDKQREFIKLFEDYAVYVYAARLGDFAGETFKIRGSRSDGDGVIVSTDVIDSGAQTSLRIDWRLGYDNGAHKINDLIVEGSMMVTQRSKFASVVQRNGGQVGSLIAMMREKTAGGAR